MAIALELPGCSTNQQVRHIVVQVLVRVAHVAAVKDERMIQQRAIAVRSILQLVDKIRQALDVLLIQPGIARDGLGILGVMRDPVEAVEYSAFRIRARSQIARVENR